MKFSFDTVEEYDLVHGSVHDAILYWKKVRQDAQGKICIQCDGTQTHYTVEEAEAKIGEYLNLLVEVEDECKNGIVRKKIFVPKRYQLKLFEI